MLSVVGGLQFDGRDVTAVLVEAAVVELGSLIWSSRCLGCAGVGLSEQAGDEFRGGRSGPAGGVVASASTRWAASTPRWLASVRKLGQCSQIVWRRGRPAERRARRQ